MSMYNSSNCGLVLPIEKIIPHLPESFQKRINDFINCDSPDPIEVMTVLREFTTADGIDGGILYPDDIFVYDGDEPNDDLEEGKMYAMWSETNNPFYTRAELRRLHYSEDEIEFFWQSNIELKMYYNHLNLIKAIEKAIEDGLMFVEETGW